MKPSNGEKRQRLFLLVAEIFGLSVIAVGITMVMLGYSAAWFSGTRFFASLLPFASFVVGVILATALLLIGWWRLRKWLLRKRLALPGIIAVCLALVFGCIMTQDRFTRGFENFRTLVGGRQEDRRITLSHQVYAAYRRYDQAQLQKMIERARQYLPAIKNAAVTFDLDPDLLLGVAAAESSYLPRQSKDGGQGLFQITQIPDPVVDQVKKYLSVDKIALEDPRQNAYIAAGELRHYLSQMNGNLFLGLLAYNIGPANGGLRFIMQQYGVTDFVTIQPYLQRLPRDYPIRVLSYSLAFRIWQKEGRLLAYEEGSNAVLIQNIGIPGLKNSE